MTKITARSAANAVLKRKDGKIAIKREGLNTWVEDIGDLFHDKQKTMRQDNNVAGNELLISEIEVAFKMKNQKSRSNDKISEEMLISCKKIGIDKICSLVNKICDSSVISKQMKEFIFISIPKKDGPTACENYRLISLMSYITKVIIQVIMRTARNKPPPEISVEQVALKKTVRQRMLSSSSEQLAKRVWKCKMTSTSHLLTMKRRLTK